MENSSDPTRHGGPIHEVADAVGARVLMSPDVGGEAETAETTPREHLNWAIKRALELYDAGQKENAVKSFMSDMTKHPGTAFIAAKPFSLMLVQTGCNTSRQEFQNMMAGFKL